MKTRSKTWLVFTAWVLCVNQAAAQQLPEKAICAVCRLHEGESKPEKVVAMSEFGGEKYYFCAKQCQETFDSDPEAYVPPVLPRPAPAFVVENLARGKISLDDLRGKVVLLDFWATWCKPCVKSMPALQKLHEQYSAQGLAVLGVSIDEQAAKKVPSFLAKNKIAYPIALDAQENAAWQAYRVKVIPALYLIDRNSRIVAQWVGEFKLDEVTDAVLAELQREIKP